MELSPLQKFERVNDCKTLEDIQQCILDFAEPDGMIQGRTRKFDANKMAKGAEWVYKDMVEPNVLTREFGLRQQLMYIKYYHPYNKSIHG